jgi:hypothetical protein
MSMWKEQIRVRMISDLFDKQREMNKEDLSLMFAKNNSLYDNYYEVIIFNNHRYRLHPRVKSWAAAVCIHPELEKRMNEIIKERDSIQEDIRTIEAWFRLLCSKCLTHSKMHQYLPESLKEFSGLTVIGKEIHAKEYVDVNINLRDTPIVLEIVARRRLTNILLG